MAIVVGLVLVLLGAASASAVTKNLERSGRLRWLPLALVPPGVLIGAGAATARDWDLWGTILAGAIVVPLAGMAFVVARHRRRSRRA